MREKLAAKIRGSLIDGQLRCATAFGVAGELGVQPLAVGLAANELDVALSHCQLGLFGYGPKAEGKHKNGDQAQHGGSGQRVAHSVPQSPGYVTGGEGQRRWLPR